MLRFSIAVSNALCDLSYWFYEHGHPRLDDLTVRLRDRFDRWMCKYVLRHQRIVYGTMRDICMDCLAIVDEHPNGRGRAA